MSHLRVLLAVGLLGCLPTAGYTQPRPLVRLTLGSQPLEGTVLSANEQQVLLLARDGFLHEFAPERAENYSVSMGDFRGYSSLEMRSRLLREFGAGYGVSQAGAFLAVHPAGKPDVWAPRLESIYRAFLHYFTARGMRPHEPQFPLTAIVFASRGEFVRYAAADGQTDVTNTLGYYSPKTNRMVMYEPSPGADWTVSAETIIHEACHQAAFNTGLHSRFGETPRWVAEGLATLFEARGVWNARQYPSQADRLNRGRLVEFRTYLGRRRTGAIAELVSSDRFFSSDPSGAYAEAWALTFFLSETEPRNYFDYLARTAHAPAFQPYRSPQRLADFTAVFGNNLALLEARFLRHMQQIKE